MNDTYESVLKSFLGKKVLIALVCTTNGEEHYYRGKLLEVTKETMKILIKLKGKIRRKQDTVFLNRKAFMILYIAKRTK